ncbi:alpha/beta hydrolase [Paenibacillus gansuensis]|uniref:Alpha/beta hydrolase n=1 Tax=Paenibacillus gansuensis TaxID=306542 RepID=A0ABW5P983_9BACL
MTAIWILLCILVLLCAVGWYFSSRIVHIAVVPHEEIWKNELAAGRFNKEKYEQAEKESVLIDSPFGYKLHGYFLPHGQSRKTVIVVHGVTMSTNASIKYAELFLKRGFNVLMYDHRRHGQSGGSTTTYGYYEKHDLKAWTAWVRDRYGPHCEIGIIGESMGAATALQYAAMDPDTAFFIIDCPYSDFRAQLAYRLKVEFKLPPFPLLGLANLFVWLRSGMSFGKVLPIRDIAGVHTPMLFITGENDTYIPPQMTKDLYEAKPGFKKLYMAPNSDHAEALANNREEYDRVVGEFIEAVELSRNQERGAI